MGWAAVLLLSLSHWGQPEIAMSNGYLRLLFSQARLISLEADPEGRGHYGPNWLVEMGFPGFFVTSESRLERGRNRLRWRHLRACREERLEVENGGVPVELLPGHTLGQSFEVKAGRFSEVSVLLPTWHTSDSSVTLRLRRGGPGGPILAQRRLERVPDNSWQTLAFEPQGPGQYFVELAEPQGHIGWWSSRRRRYAGGMAYADGRPLPEMERTLRVPVQREVGVAELEIILEGPCLGWLGRVRPWPGEGTSSWPLTMRMKWDNTGYEVSERTVPFFRFFSNTMRYMPVQQLKRWRERDGWYELTFDGCRWVEAEGTGRADWRVYGDGLSLAWHLADKEATLRWSVRPAWEEGLITHRFLFEIKPRRDDLPSSWPRFTLPRRQDSQEANLFFYERALTYPPLWGPAAWFEWNALTRLWQGGPHLEALRRHWEEYPITEEGYVHTWGAAPGWPFPDNTRYDTRHFDTNARFILACWRYAAWTGDREFLKRQAERLRRAMEYQLTVLRGEEGLIVTASKDVTGRHMGVGNNYWDILPFGHWDAYANVVWYASLEAMAQIEEMLSREGGVETKALARSPSFYRELAQRVRRLYNEVFWDEEKGRYIGCVDVDGRRHDYGFTFINLEAMAYGLADEAKARRIYRWMETEPTSTGKPDTYTAWVFAPRANTLHNPRWHPEKGKLEDVPQEPWWHFGWHGTAYGDQCQDGGAILYTSFYDLMARTRFLGPDNAWQRWQEILARWRLPDRLCGGPPLFRGEHPQQIFPGAVGTDIPFPESGLVPCWLLYGLLGVQATSHGLEVAPRLPAALPWLEVRNVAYRGLLLNIRSDGREVLITCNVPGSTFAWRRRVSPGGKVVFAEPTPPVRFPQRPLWEGRTAWRGQWIWLADREARYAFFRHRFELPSRPQRAWLTLTADNAFVLYVNGRCLARGNDWTMLHRLGAEALLPHLRKGTNIIAIEVENTGGPGGLLLEGQVFCPEGKPCHLFTNRQWRASSQPGEGWFEAEFDDSLWLPASEYGPPPCPPWGDMGHPQPWGKGFTRDKSPWRLR